MSQLKLLDLDFLGDDAKGKELNENAGVDVEEGTEGVPVHLFLSPNHSASSARVSSSSSNETRRRRRRLKETTFVTVEKHRNDSDNELVSSASASPVTVSSGQEELTSPSNRPRTLARRTNKIQDVDHKTSHVVIREDASKRRSSGETHHDVEGGRSITSMSDHVSDHLSYKDRIRDHINSVRERAADSVSRPQSRSQSRTQSRMKMLLANRPAKGEDILKREEREVSVALERHQKLRGQWRQLSQELLRRKADKEGYEFFTQDGEVEGESPPIADEPISPALTDKSRDGKMTVADCLDLRADYEPVVWCPAQLAPDTSDKFKALIFYPSSRPVPYEEKLEEGLNPRFTEDEGLYVENKENRPRRMKYRLEQRLLKVPGGKKWFGPDGELLSRPSKLIFSLEIHETTIRGVLYQFPTLPTPQQGLEDGHVVLDLELLAVRFSHHSLFSREHILAHRLRELWRRFRQLRHTDSCRRLKGQLDALRRARDFAKDGEENRLNIDIKDICSRWFAESLSERQLETRLLATWRDLQRLREEQGYRSTSIQLVIKQKPGRDTEEWEKDVATEISEALNDAWRQFRTRKVKYDQELEAWRENIAAGEEDIEQSEEVTASPPPPTPVPPVDQLVIEQEVREKFRTSFRNPGEPEIELSLGDLGPPTAASDAKEEARRGAVKRQEVIVKLLCNGKEVYRSDPQPLSSVFTVKFGQRFAVRLLEWPRSLSLQLVESGRPPCDVFLPFPDCLTTVDSTEVEAHEFSCAAVATHAHSGVGCGRDIVACPGGSEFNSKPVCLFTSGTVTCRLGWAVDAFGEALAPPRHFWNVRRAKGLEAPSRTHADVSKLREWVEKARLDPNDPGNARVFHVLNQSDPIPTELTAINNELDFCSADVILNNPRLRLLRLRDQGEPEFRGYQMVPLCEKLIHPDIFKAYEARVARPVEQETVVDPLDSHRAVGRRQMEQIRQAVLQRCRQARQHRRLADIVTEDQVPDLGTLGLTLMRWLRPKRPLRPERKQRKKVAVQNLVGQDVSIVVNVVRAFEVPVRKDMDSMSATESIDGFSLVNVRPFVSATFRGESARTTAAEGANPTWNQDLVLPVRTSTGDFSPGVLAGMKDTLYLHLFDEVVVDLVEEDGMRDTMVHQRLEKHWLAGLEIPFSTLYCNSRVEGTFQLYSPPVLLGYEREAHRITGGALPQRDATYLTLFITVQPALNPPEPFLDVFETTESPGLEAHLRGWQAEVNSLYPSRKVSPLVSTAAATAVCITRLIRPLPPPALPALAEEPTTPAAAARFVARIPTMASATFFPGLLNVWLTCDQVVSMLSGDAEDHAVLLCCFLMHMGLPAYLLLGVGIPHGASAYVLVNSPRAEVVWDPTTGCKYSVRDSFCPLQKVHCLVSNSNIWANIQDEDSPRRIRFDVTKRADWLPAFSKSFAAPVDSIQPESLDFKETSRQAVQALQDKLESRLRDGMMKWRRRQRTQWNRYCAATMRKLLPRLEEACWEVGDPTSPDHWQGLNHILASHKVCGFPINMAYTDMEAVMEAVKATGLHTCENEQVEFALAVYIYPYPCDVLSVWVYVASLMRRR